MCFLQRFTQIQNKINNRVFSCFPSTPNTKDYPLDVKKNTIITDSRDCRFHIAVWKQDGRTCMPWIPVLLPVLPPRGSCGAISDGTCFTNDRSPSGLRLRHMGPIFGTTAHVCNSICTLHHHRSAAPLCMMAHARRPHAPEMGHNWRIVFGGSPVYGIAYAPLCAALFGVVDTHTARGPQQLAKWDCTLDSKCQYLCKSVGSRGEDARGSRT